MTSGKGKNEVHFSEFKPIPKNYWRLFHPVLVAFRLKAKEPRGVTGYNIQQIPDGCHNCIHLCHDNKGKLGCELSFANPKIPFDADQVNPFGKCDKFAKWDGK